MAENLKNELDNWTYQSTRVFENADYSLLYSGPDPKLVDRVVVTFPDLIHMTGVNASGWGESLFTKREQPVLCLIFNEANWYQSNGFFETLHAAREFVGAETNISTYGSSMGGYGAILASTALRADLAIALSPQFTVEQDIAPFERRYRAEAKRIGKFRHDVTSELNNKTNYVVVYDPTHKTDRLHEALFPQPKNWMRLPIPGASHGTLPTIVEMGATKELFDLTVGRISPREFRNSIRSKRRSSYRYIRRMGNKSAMRNSSTVVYFSDIAKKAGYDKLVSKWRVQLKGISKVQPTIWIHPGLPKTGTTSIQSYFMRNAKEYARKEIIYPTEGALSRDFSHSWLSLGLRNGDLSELKQQLDQVPMTAEHLILSDESLYVELPFLSGEIRTQLKNMLSPFEIKIVICERSLAAWKKSFYLQSLKNRRSKLKKGASRLWGSQLSYAEFFQEEFLEDLTNFKRMKEDLQALFGTKSIKTLKMTPSSDIVPTFCDALEIQHFEDDNAPKKNISMQDVDGEVLRQANSLNANQSGFVKRLMSMSDDVTLSSFPEKRRLKFTQLAKGYPWDSFEYKKNPPLRYTKAAFDSRIASLKRRADMFLTRQA